VENPTGAGFVCLACKAHFEKTTMDWVRRADGKCECCGEATTVEDFTHCCPECRSDTFVYADIKCQCDKGCAGGPEILLAIDGVLCCKEHVEPVMLIPQKGAERCRKVQKGAENSGRRKNAFELL